MQSADKYISLHIFPGKIHIFEKMRVCGQVGEYRKCGEYPELGMAQIARILYFLHQHGEDLTYKLIPFAKTSVHSKF